MAESQGVTMEQLPVAPPAQAAPAQREFEGLGSISRGSSWWKRPKNALKDRSFLPDDIRKPLWIANVAASKNLAVGSRVWVKGTLKRGLLSIAEFVAFPTSDPASLTAKAENAAFSIEVLEVSPWYDHITDSRNLVIATKLVNKTDKPLEVALSGAFLSLEAASEGQRIVGLSIRGRDGLSSGRTTVMLSPAASLKLELRGDNLYPASSQGKTLHVTLQLEQNAESLFVRSSGTIIVPQ